MSLYDQIIDAIPELADKPEEFFRGSIELQDDGEGAYIKRWEYIKPIPASLKDYDRT